MKKTIKTQPSYYAIIPADVRYSDIQPNAKLLYGEITALANKDGYCWATNSYFAELYGVAITTVSEWIKNLTEKGFIRYELDNNTNRIIYLTLREKSKGASGKAEAYPSGKAEYNNTRINTTIKTIAFSEFWNIYPKKVDKKKSEAKWNRLPITTQSTLLS